MALAARWADAISSAAHTRVSWSADFGARAIALGCWNHFSDALCCGSCRIWCRRFKAVARGAAREDVLQNLAKHGNCSALALHCDRAVRDAVPPHDEPRL